jgi:tetratricopeptide (TPR) repeat protein
LVFILFTAITFIAWKKKQATLLFSCLFFIVSIFLFIKVLTTVGAITYDRYFYVASFGFCLVFGVGIQFLHQSKNLRVLGISLLVGISSFWFWKTQDQLKIWENSFTLTGNMLKYYPKHLPFAYNNRGLWLNEQKRLPEAVENFKNAILLDPNSPNAWLNAGKSFGDMGKPDSAILYLENCLKRSEGDSKVYNNLGNAYGLLGNFPKALQNFEKAILLDPDNANALYNLAVTYGIQGDTLKADSILRISAKKGNEGARNSLNARGKL